MESRRALYVRLDGGGPSEPGHYKCLIEGCLWESEGISRRAPLKHAQSKHPDEWANHPGKSMVRADRRDKTVEERKAEVAEKNRRYRQRLKVSSHAWSC